MSNDHTLDMDIPYQTCTIRKSNVSLYKNVIIGADIPYIDEDGKRSRFSSIPPRKVIYAHKSIIGGVRIHDRKINHEIREYRAQFTRNTHIRSLNKLNTQMAHLFTKRKDANIAYLKDNKFDNEMAVFTLDEQIKALRTEIDSIYLKISESPLPHIKINYIYLAHYNTSYRVLEDYISGSTHTFIVSSPDGNIRMDIPRSEILKYNFVAHVCPSIWIEELGMDFVKLNALEENPGQLPHEQTDPHACKLAREAMIEQEIHDSANFSAGIADDQVSAWDDDNIWQLN